MGKVKFDKKVPKIGGDWSRKISQLFCSDNHRRVVELSSSELIGIIVCED